MKVPGFTVDLSYLKIGWLVRHSDLPNTIKALAFTLTACNPTIEPISA